MGWTFNTTRCTKAEYVANLLKGWTQQADGKTITYSYVARACRGKNLWAVCLKTVDGIEVERHITLNLLDSMKGCWGDKAICEEMGPCEVDCPVSFLDLVPEPKGEYCAPWRAKVRAYHAIHSQKLEVGATYAMRAGFTIKTITLDSVGKRMTGVADNGVRYSIRRGQLGARLIPVEV